MADNPPEIGVNDEYLYIDRDDIGDPFVQTEDDIRLRMQERIAQIFRDRNIKPDFREGSLLNTMLSPAAKELSLYYEEMAVLLSMGFLETAVLDYLDAKGVELGVPRLLPANSEGTVRFLGDDPRVEAEDPATADTTFIPPGTVVSTVTTDPEQLPQQFSIDPVNNTTQTVDVEAMSITATPNPDVAEGWGDGTDGYIVESASILDDGGAGWPVVGTGITGNVMYKFTYVTTIGMRMFGTVDNPDYEEGYGETNASERSLILEDLVDAKVRVTLPEPPTYTNLNTIYQINVYRALDEGGGFSDFKKIGSIDAIDNPAMELWDTLDNVNFTVSEAFLQETNTTGVVDLGATSLEQTEAANIPARTIEILEDTIDGVTKVTNPLQFSQGLDSEEDDDYRERLLATIKKVPGAGTVQDYIDWALEIPGINGVTVIPEWEEMFGYPNGPGTVKVQVAGEESQQVNSLIVEKVRQHIAGDIAVVNPYAWNDVANGGTAKLDGTAIDRTDGDIQPGTYQYVYTYVNVGGGETEHNAVKPVDIESDTDSVPLVFSEVFEITVDGVTENAVHLTGLTTGQDGVSVENVVYRRIYRREINQVDEHGDPDPKFYLVGIHFNTEPNPTEFIDIVGTPFSRYAPIVNSTSLFNGKAPIGAHITVESINEFAVTVLAHVVTDPGYTLSGVPGAINVKPKIDQKLAEFFLSVTSGSRVYYTDILNAIHDAEGVLDFYDVVVSAPGFDDMDGSPGSPRFWQLTTGADIVFNDEGSVYIEEVS